MYFYKTHFSRKVSAHSARSALYAPASVAFTGFQHITVIFPFHDPRDQHLVTPTCKGRFDGPFFHSEIYPLFESFLGGKIFTKLGKKLLTDERVGDRLEYFVYLKHEILQ